MNSNEVLITRVFSEAVEAWALGGGIDMTQMRSRAVWETGVRALDALFAERAVTVGGGGW